MKMPSRTLNSVVGIALLLAIHPAALACVQRQPTPSASQGPHDYSVAPAESRLWREGDAGEPLFLHIRVLDTCGNSVAGARVQVLHANHHGDHEPDRWRAQLDTDERGELKLATVFPGYAGGLARHIHFIITHPGHPPLVTRMFFKNDPAIDAASAGWIERLAVVLEAFEYNDVKGWVTTFEIVLPEG